MARKIFAEELTTFITERNNRIPTSGTSELENQKHKEDKPMDVKKRCKRNSYLVLSGS